MVINIESAHVLFVENILDIFTQ